MPASYDGFSLGLIFKMETVGNPKSRQINSYPGADGLQVIDHGTRGRTTQILGALGASTPSGLAALEERMHQFQRAGRPSILINQFDVMFDGVILTMFRTQGRVQIAIGGGLPRGGYARMYIAEFLHIS